MNLPSRLAQLGLKPSVTTATSAPIVVVQVVHPATGTTGQFDIGNVTGNVLRAKLGGREALGQAEVEQLLADWQRERNRTVRPERFVRERLAEARWPGGRPAVEAEALGDILQVAVGCPGCGVHGGPPHACPGGRDRFEHTLDMNDPWDPWRAVVLALARLWAGHPDYNPGWEKTTPAREDEREEAPSAAGAESTSRDSKVILPRSTAGTRQ